jgi:hypothetical protein
MKKTNPIACRVEALQGQRMAPGWEQRAHEVGKSADAAYLDRLQNAWKTPLGNQGNTIQQARLQNPRQDSAIGSSPQQPIARHDGQQSRFDGQLVLVDDRADGWQQWRDNTTGATIWRRLQWSDVVGLK